MNPLTNAKNLQKLNAREISGGTVGTKTSWHEQYRQSAWIFFGGMPYELTEGDIIIIFSQYGEIVNLNLIRDQKTGKSKGFGFCCYEDQRSTDLAVDNFNTAKILGRVIRVDHVNDYKPPKDHDDSDDVTKFMREEGCSTRVVSEKAPAEAKVYNLPPPRRPPPKPASTSATEEHIKIKIEKDDDRDYDRFQHNRDRERDYEKKRTKDHHHSHRSSDRDRDRDGNGGRDRKPYRDSYDDDYRSSDSKRNRVDYHRDRDRDIDRYRDRARDRDRDRDSNRDRDRRREDDNHSRNSNDERKGNNNNNNNNINSSSSTRTDRKSRSPDNVSRRRDDHRGEDHRSHR